MATNKTKYRLLKNGIGHEAALYLSDPAKSGAATVAAPAAMTAPGTMGASYTQAEQNQLRTDVANLRSTVATLLTNLKNAGVVQ